MSVLATTCLVTPAAAPAQTPTSDDFHASCEARLPLTRIRVRSLPSSVTYNFSSSAEQLTSRPDNTMARGLTTLGLTESVFQLEVSAGSTKLVNSATGQACMRPQLNITVQVGPQRVSVAREFPQGTCAFNEIVQHELRHVYANQAQLERTADQLEQTLKAKFGNQVFYGTDAELTRAFSDNIKTAWIPWGQAKYLEGRRAHETIDSPAEYARNNTMCGGIVPRVLASRQH